MQNNNQVDSDNEKKRTIKIAIIIVLVLMFIGFIFFISIGAITYFAFKKNAPDNTLNVVVDAPSDGQGYNKNTHQPPQGSFNKGPLDNSNEFQINSPQSPQYNPQTGTFQKSPSVTSNPEVSTGSAIQTVNPIDRQVGISPFSIDIPQGWTYELESKWDKNTAPMVSVSFTASDSAKIGLFYISPMQQFTDLENPNNGDGLPPNLRLMKPREAFEYIINIANQSNPEFAQKQYKILNVTDYPEENRNGQQIYVSDILAEFVDAGLPKEEFVKVSVVSSTTEYGKLWSIMWYGLQDRKGVPVEKLSAMLNYIVKSQRPNPEWGKKVMETTSAWNNEKSISKK